MKLGSSPADTLEPAVRGYQFPQAEDPRLRYSWHIICGRARTGTTTWEFSWQALACDESTHLLDWLIH